MGTQNDPKSGSKNEAKWGPKIDQNGDPKSIKMGTQNSMTHRGMTHSVILLYYGLFKERLIGNLIVPPTLLLDFGGGREIRN